MKIKQKTNKFFLVSLSIFSLALLAACGSSSSDSSASDTAETTTSAAATTASENVLEVIEETFGRNGNLWKPRSEVSDSGGGNLVVLLNSRYNRRFDTCRVRRTDGTNAPLLCNDQVPWTEIPFSCFSNGNRQTWRANFRCESAAEVRVVCRNATQEVIFVAPSGSAGAVCNRFG